MVSRSGVYYLPACLCAVFTLAAFVGAMGACGDEKPKAESTDDAQVAKVKPPPELPKSAFTEACDKHSDAAKKADCLCRVAAMQARLGDELMKKFETAPSTSAEDAIEHVGGVGNLSKIYDAMRVATEQCAKGVAK